MPRPARTLSSLLLQYLGLALLALTLNFFLLRLAPGSPLLGLEHSEIATALSEEQKQRLLTQYGLDQSLLGQFWQYAGRMLRGDLGTSLYYNQPVTQAVWPYLERTLLLVLLGFLPALLLGVGLGLVSALNYKQAWERWLLGGLVLLQALPPFLIAILLLILLAVVWPVFPVVSTMLPGQGLGDRLERLALPVLAYVLWELGLFYLFARGAFLSVLGNDHMAYARAKGLPERIVIFRHLLRAALPPLVARTALILSASFGGVFFIEAVFGYPGLSTLSLTAIARFDYPLIEGIFLLTLGTILLFNLLADLLVMGLDPRTAEGR